MLLGSANLMPLSALAFFICMCSSSSGETVVHFGNHTGDAWRFHVIGQFAGGSSTT